MKRQTPTWRHDTTTVPIEGLHRPMARRRRRPFPWEWVFCGVLLVTVSVLMYGMAVVRFGLGAS